MPIYLDNSATTQVRPEVLEAMLPHLSESWGNPSSIHSLGRRAAKSIQAARVQVAALLNCLPEEVYFSSGGTMSNNVSLLGRARFAEANRHGRHLITTQIEHPAILGPAQYLESTGWKVTYLPVDKYGIVRIDDLVQAITADTSMISVMWANNEIGSLQPIEQVAKIAFERGIYIHTDAVQVPGKLALDLDKVPVSALSLAGHKFYAPKGVGVLFLRKLQNVMPILFGGGQEMGLLPGTEGLANIVGLGRAAELAHEELEMNAGNLRVAQELIVGKLTAVPGVCVSGPINLSDRLPGHASFYIAGKEGESLVLRADLRGICISSGSACHKGIIEASQVMRAIGLSDEQAMGSVRISVGRFNTLSECQNAAGTLVEVFSSAVADTEKPARKKVISRP
jgi:cysteine desulfurase